MPCYYCGVSFEQAKRTIEHIRPLSQNGSKVGRNTVEACNVCNSIKGDRTIEHSRPRLIQKMLGWPKFTVEQLEWLRARSFDLSEYDDAKLYFERKARSRARIVPKPVKPQSALESQQAPQ